MTKYDITYTVDADNLNHAQTIAHTHIYLADVEADKVTVNEVKPPKADPYATFGDVPTEYTGGVYERIVGAENPDNTATRLNG